MEWPRRASGGSFEPDVRITFTFSSCSTSACAVCEVVRENDSNKVVGRDNAREKERNCMCMCMCVCVRVRARACFIAEAIRAEDGDVDRPLEDEGEGARGERPLRLWPSREDGDARASLHGELALRHRYVDLLLGRVELGHQSVELASCHCRK